MRFTLSAFVFVVTITIFSIFIANVTNLISTDQTITKKLTRETNHGTTLNHHENLQIADSAEHLMWFIQISDLHISIFSDSSRITQLREFTTKSIDAIRPSVVLASGDLTDARAANFIDSTQFEKEWKTYNDILHEADIPKKTLWLDIRGNHDNFNVPGTFASTNYYNRYSMQGEPRSYMKQVVVGGDKYTFIAVDACLDPGPKRQFNFIGLLTLRDTEELIDFVHKSREEDGNYTIWFGHYPTSCIIAPGTGPSGIRNVIGQFKEGYVYLCGHLHTLGGMVPQLHTLHKEGFLELELGDWKENRLFRVAAIDHGLFSFVDVRHNEWPIVLITNPKHPLYRIPSRENARLQLDSTHIRILAFSLDDILKCEIRLIHSSDGNNDNRIWNNCEKINRNLYVLKWNPHEFNDNRIHHIEVLVQDELGRTKHIRQPFTHGDIGDDLQFGKLARFALMTDIASIFKGLFWTMIILCVIPLCGFRVWHRQVANQKINRPRIKSLFLKRLVCKMWLLASIDRLFFPLIFYPIYLTFGPWSFGDVINGHTSVVFVWGIYVQRGFLPGGLTYLYGFFQLILCQFPLIFIYANIVYRKFQNHLGGNIEPPPSKLQTIFRNVGFFLIILIELILMYVYYVGYGVIAMLVDPVRTWSVILNIFLWYHARNLSPKLLRPGTEIWRTDPNLIVIDKD